MLGVVEAFLPFGGDFSIDSRGDLVLVQDVSGSPAATIQRLVQVILTNSRLIDPITGVAIGRADDLFNPDYGASASRDVGQLPTEGILADLQSRIQAGIALDPGITNSPPPVVAVSVPTPGTVLVNVSATTVTGQYVAVPTQTLQFFSAQ